MLDDKARTGRRQKRNARWRWALVSVLTIFASAMVLSRSFTVETTRPNPPPSPSPAATPTIEPEASPSPALSPTPSPSPSPSPLSSPSPSRVVLPSPSPSPSPPSPPPPSPSPSPPPPSPSPSPQIVVLTLAGCSEINLNREGDQIKTAALAAWRRAIQREPARSIDGNKGGLGTSAEALEARAQIKSIKDCTASVSVSYLWRVSGPAMPPITTSKEKGITCRKTRDEWRCSE